MSLYDKLKSNLKTQVTDLQSNINAKESEAEKLRQRREQLEQLPLPKQDCLNHLQGLIDEMGSRYHENMRHQLEGSLLAGNAMNLPQRFPLLAPHTGSDANKVMPFALFALLGEQMKEGLNRVIDNMDWPEAGPTISEREAEIKRIDAKLTSLEAELIELRSIANEAGVRV